MKKLFLFLLLVNIVFYLWETNIKRENAPLDTKSMVDSGLKPITLAGELARTNPEVLKERKLATQPLNEAKATFSLPANSDLLPLLIEEKSKQVFMEEEQVEAVETVNQRASSAICYRVSPFKDEKSALNFQKETESVVQSELVEQRVTENRGYWALYPAAQNMAQAKMNVRWLKENGVSDLWLFRKGENRGAISLGLFKKRQGAEKIKEKLLKKGIKIEIRMFAVSTTEFSLKLSWDGDAAILVDRLNEPLESHPEAALITVTCN